MSGTSLDDALERTRDVTLALWSLPSVPTLDWLERAAAAVCGIGAGSMCTIMLARTRADGEIVSREAAGVGAAPDVSMPSGLQLGAIQSRAHRLTAAGFTPDPGDTAGISVQRLGPAWRAGPQGKLWAGLPGEHVLCVLSALTPLGHESLLISVLSPTSPDAAARVLGAVLPLLIERVAHCLGPTIENPRNWLTAREQEVLEQLTLGRSVKQIAETLGRSPHTVHDHVKALHRKLEANTRGELIARALGHLAGSSADPVASEVEPKAPPALLQPDRLDTPSNAA